MIVRSEGSSIELISQPDHARLARPVMEGARRCRCIHVVTASFTQSANTTTARVLPKRTFVDDADLRDALKTAGRIQLRGEVGARAPE